MVQLLIFHCCLANTRKEDGNRDGIRSRVNGSQDTIYRLHFQNVYNEVQGKIQNVQSERQMDGKKKKNDINIEIRKRM